VQAKCGKEIKGKLITVTYDTLIGYIKKIPDKKLFTHLKFRSSSDNFYVDLKPEQIEAFITDEFSVVSFKISLNNVDRYVFIKKILEGTLDLYYSWVADNSDLINDCNTLYFVGFEDGRIIQMQKRFLIRTLQAIFNDCECTLQKIEPKRFDYYYYKSRKLLDLFATYNSCAHSPLAMGAKQKGSRSFKP
jgi:hypothetical protein